MRLLYSAASPFAPLETGLDARVTKQEVTWARLYASASEVLAFNPVGRVPTLESDEARS
jgi:hypothetical protein